MAPTLSRYYGQPAALCRSEVTCRRWPCSQAEKLIKASTQTFAKDGDQRAAVDGKALLAKLNSHLLCKFFALTILCYLDRTNLAFAAIQLNSSLGFTEHIYGVGASIFFVGYSICQIPSNLILVRVGAPRWLSVLIVSWGVVATAFAATQGKWSFYILRLLLGATESGNFPGMWYHLSTFYTEKEIGVAYSYVSAGTALSQVRLLMHGRCNGAHVLATASRSVSNGCQHTWVSLTNACILLCKMCIAVRSHAVHLKHRIIVCMVGRYGTGASFVIYCWLQALAEGRMLCR